MSIIDSSFFYEEVRGGGRSEEQTFSLICLSEKAFDAENPREKKKGAHTKYESTRGTKEGEKNPLWGTTKPVYRPERNRASWYC